MSARRGRGLTVEEDARFDIEEMLLYTLEYGGAEQRRRYRAKLKQAMRSLLDHPELGQPRDDLYPGCRSLLVGRHVVFYRIADDEIIIGRVLHSSQNPTGKVVS